MKHILFVLLISMIPLCVPAQTDTGKMDSTALLQDSTLADHGEAGGIPAGDETNTTKDSTSSSWLYFLLFGAGGLIVGLLAGRAMAPKKKDTTAPALQAPVAEELATPGNNAAANRKLKQELAALTAQLEALQNERDALSKNLDIYRNFDNSYYNEAFRKLIAPMNEALENGSRREILEHLMKIMIHFTSLTRYKIAKKQPYDEANIHYLLNQKGNGAASVTEINGDTPIDKIPKNIRTLIDMLKEQESKGLDDSILAGYKIKSL